MVQHNRSEPVLFDRGAAALHLGALFEEREGFVALAFRLPDPEDPRNREADWREQQCSWPDQRDQVLDAVGGRVGQGWDVYVTPLLRVSGGRRKANGACGRVVWADADDPAAFQTAVRGPLQDLEGWVLASGTPGHHQIFLPVEATLGPASWRSSTAGSTSSSAGAGNGATNRCSAWPARPTTSITRHVRCNGSCHPAAPPTRSRCWMLGCRQRRSPVT